MSTEVTGGERRPLSAKRWKGALGVEDTNFFIKQMFELNDKKGIP
jgi:hypothetical protein